MLQLIQANPLIALAIAGVIAYLLFRKGDATAETNGHSTARQLPTIVPLAKSRTPVEAYESLDVVVKTMRRNGCPEPEIQAIVENVAPKLFRVPVDSQ